MNEKLNLQKQVEPLIRKAGEILLSFYGKQLTKKYKPHHGFATEADLASEKFLIEELGKVLPEASFFAEESGKSGNHESDYCWVIDPLDGTTNFAHQLPYFCVSIALTHNDVPIFGMIYQPLEDELFWAQKGKGAYLNGKKISVSHPTQLEKTLFVVGFPYHRGARYDHLLERVKRVRKQTYTFRYFGAAALDQVYVAAGRLDASILENLAWWDIAAGMIIIQQAGGIVTTFENKQVTPDFGTYVSASPEMHKQMLELLK